MKQKRFSEEQIIRILRDAESSESPIVDVVKKSISENTF
jgi:hypothetical protein